MGRGPGPPSASTGAELHVTNTTPKTTILKIVFMALLLLVWFFIEQIGASGRDCSHQTNVGGVRTWGFRNHPKAGYNRSDRTYLPTG